MATQVQWRGGSTAEHSTFTGAAREITVDTQKKTLVVHDGSTAGGEPLLREDGSNSALDLGSAATPALKFTGDTNTGIYSPGADQVAISTGGTGRLSVDASGNVGIGTTPAFGAIDHGLQIKGSGAQEGIRLETTNGSGGILEIYSENGGNTLDTRGSGYIRFSNTTTEWGRWDSSGRLGLGTSSPGSKLDINQGSSYGPGNGLRLTNAAGNRWDISLDQASMELGFAYNASNKVTIKNNGLVGIGTQTPGALLDVTGSNGKMLIANGITSDSMRLIAQNASGTGNAELVFQSWNLEYGRFDTSGRFLVGTSSDSGGALLQVNGNRIRIATAKTPASATDTGTAGEICWDANYIYVCTATNTWKRSAISTW